MRISLKISILFVIIWFIGKMSFFYLQLFQDEAGVKVQVMWNILCLLMGMTIGTWIEKRRESASENSALNDIKNTMGSGIVYTVLVSFLIYLYYAKIDPGYNERQLAIAEASVNKMLDDPKEMAKIKKNNPDLESLTREEIYEKAIANQKAMFSPGSTMTISLLGMLLLSTVNAIILTVIFRRVLFKQRTL
jgi:hypothetical protein